MLLLLFSFSEDTFVETFTMCRRANDSLILNPVDHRFPNITADFTIASKTRQIINYMSVSFDGQNVRTLNSGVPVMQATVHSRREKIKGRRTYVDRCLEL